MRNRSSQLTATIAQVPTRVSLTLRPARPTDARPAAAAWARAVEGLAAFRLVVVGALAATVLITWPLWQVRESPPMLPALPLPVVDLGPALLAVLALTLIRPRLSAVALTALLLYGAAIDQTRLQPQMVSMMLLLWGTLESGAARTLARAHLIAMWGFAGINKLLSPAFHDEMAPWIVRGLVPDAPQWMLDRAGLALGLSELIIGLLVIVPRTRRVAAVAALGLHTGILLDLSPLGHDWNQSVWPWNAALAVAGFAFLWSWEVSPRIWLARSRPVVRAAALLLLLSPAGFYVGVVDAYLAHNLYSANTADAFVSCRGACPDNRRPSWTWDALNVPLPPEHRLHRAYFEATCRPGDRLQIIDTRWWYERQDKGVQRHQCPP